MSEQHKTGWQEPPRSWPTGERGTVGELWGGVDHLQAVLDSAGDEVVVLKFKREGCPACGSTNARYTEMAKAYAGRARLFFVDYHQCLKFCQACGLRAVPCVHVYQQNEMLEVMALGPSSWDAFAELMEEVTHPPTTRTDSSLSAFGDRARPQAASAQREGREKDEGSGRGDPWDGVEASALRDVGF